MKPSFTTTSLAAAAALIAISATIPATGAQAAGTDSVHCYGVNSCKGQSDCKTAHNSCKGMNTCKGMGFKDMTEEACKAANGSLTMPE